MAKSHCVVKRTRITLAGLGVVGGGVYERLRAQSDLYEVVGVLCRSPKRLAQEGAPASLFAAEFCDLAEFDILVEAIGGLEPAGEIILAALARGANVVTSNKSLVSRRFDELDAAARRGGAQLLYSAAVGGGVPMLETADEIAAQKKISKVEAVLNGTTNFVLDRIGAGASFESAIQEARSAGYTEADPTADIDGIDAAEKLSLLARRAFNAAFKPDEISTDRLSALSPKDIVAAARAGRPFKQIASAAMVADKVEACVHLRRVEAHNALGKPRLEENCLVITCIDGERHVVHGSGAGRKPTANSVMCDIERATGLYAAQGRDAVNSIFNGGVNESASPPR